MESDGRWIELEEIEYLLKWQYSHLIELDDYMIYHAQGYKSVFIEDKKWFDKTFISQTIIRFNGFRKGIGKGLIFKNKPINDLIDEIDAHKAWLVTFKKKHKKVDADSQSIARSYLLFHNSSLIHVLTSVTSFILNREFDYVQNLDGAQAKKAVRKKLLELNADKINAPGPCRLREEYREKEYKLYELLSQHLTVDDSYVNSESTELAKERVLSNVYNIQIIGNSNTINTGNHASLKVDIRQSKTRQPVTTDTLMTEISQLTQQIRQLLEQVTAIESDTKEEVAHQVTTVEKLIGKDKPNFSLIGKTLQIIESLLLDAATSETTPLILSVIQRLIPQLVN